MSDLLRQLQDALLGPFVKPPKEYLTAQQWADKWKLSLPHARKLLINGVRKEIMKMQKFRITTAGRGPMSIPHYAQSCKRKQVAIRKARA